MNAPAATPTATQAPPAFGIRLGSGLFGILLAAIVAGLNNRVPSLLLADLQGAFSLSSDKTSWLSTIYTAGELSIMPFATWFAITFSLRRFHLMMLISTMVIACFLPFTSSYPLLLVMRAIQGITAGALIPMLMMSALRFLPPNIRLHGLALYAMTATFAPNVALWVASLCMDSGNHWQWIYWHIIPLGALAALLVYWGIPKMPLALPRIKQANWLGMLFGMPGLFFLAITIDQGNHLDWWRSSVISATALLGGVFLAIFVFTEWFHEAPFMRLQLLSRRNLGLGFILFLALLVLMTTAVGLPANVLAHLHGFRAAQTDEIGLVVGLPQLILGPLTSLLLYQKWVDARKVFALGLLFMCAGIYCNTYLTDEWMANEFLLSAFFQAIGQPLAIIPLLFLATSVVQPMEGPSVSGIVNMLRGIGTLVGGAFIGHWSSNGAIQYADTLQGASEQAQSGINPVASLVGVIAEQASLLTTIDIYRFFALMAVVMVPFVLMLQYIPPPVVNAVPPSKPN